MSLWWSVNKVADKDTLCFIADGDELNVKAVTGALIEATMAVGMNSITARNYKTFHRRLGEWSQAARGWFLHDWNKHVNHRHGERVECEYNPSLDDVRQHVGLATNADTLTATQFQQKLDKLSSG